MRMDGWMPLFEPVIPAGQEYMYDTWRLAPAVRAGNLLICSGSLGFGPDGNIPAEPDEQFPLVFDNLAKILDAAGGSLANVIELLSFHIDLNKHIAQFADVKTTYFPGPYPAHTAVGVAELGVPNALVEVRATAILAPS